MPDRSEPDFDYSPEAGRAASSRTSKFPANSVAAPVASAASKQKGLWIAVGVLGTAVVALAATLASQHLPNGDQDAAVRTNVASVQPASPMLPMGANKQQSLTPAEAAAAGSPALTGAPSLQNSQKNKAQAIAGRAQLASNSIAKEGVIQPYTRGSTAPVVTAPGGTAGLAPSQQQQSPQPQIQATYAAQEPTCPSCGRVESVRATRRTVPTTGVGAVAGGVLGALVGNSFGHGNGRVATTVLGAAGGGYLGNTVESNSHARTVYQVRVRMENGTFRTFDRASSVAVGTPVTVEGHGFRLGHPAVIATTQARGGYPVSQQTAQQQQGVYGTRTGY